ncbi:collagen alpha-5(IV) chain-like [Pantherophis guttatus]|uniref:Collagen alpha-5(IV) chain-like n=1 Tax=Pantherophis guttatus TaxID=94885 RepID=A0A6P9DN01_PANGU|nr:collagen alpha-5(IV) chain-like [Pantherophis guttatus]XP_034296968.1 collagen alpha-5(IV) chain-like [Pantherophis guttatus]
MASDTRSQIPEPPDSVPAVQDAVPPDHLGGHQTWRLPLVNRPDGGIPPCTHPPRPPQVSPLLFPEPALSVQGSSIRPLIGPQGIHKIDGRHRGPPQVHPHPDAVLPGRPSGPVSLGESGPSRSLNDSQSPGIPRILYQSDQEPSGPGHASPTPGGDHRHESMQGLPFPGSPGQPAVSGQDSEGREGLFPGFALPTPGKDGLLHRHSSLGTSSLQGSAVVPPTLPETGDGVLPPAGPSSSQGAPVPRLVVLGSSSPGAGVQGSSVSYTDYRCQPSRLGGPPILLPRPGSMDPGGFKAQHKLAGTPGHPPGPTSLCPRGSGQACPGQNGQRGRQGPCEPLGRDPLSASHGGSRETGLLGGVAPKVIEGNSHLGGGELSGGLVEQDHGGPRGVDPGTCSLSGDHISHGSSSPGPLRHTEQSTDPEVLRTVSGTRSGGRGCSTQRLASRPSIRLPSSSHRGQGHQEDVTREGRAAANRPPLASQALVRGPEGSLGSASLAPSPGQSHPSPGFTSSSGRSMAAANRLAIERRLLSSRRLPPRVVATIQAARRPLTTRIYDSTWRTFSSWCDSHSIISTAASTEQVLIYLQDRLDSAQSACLRRRLSSESWEADQRGGASQLCRLNQ